MDKEYYSQHHDNQTHHKQLVAQDGDPHRYRVG